MCTRAFALHLMSAFGTAIHTGFSKSFRRHAWHPMYCSAIRRIPQKKKGSGVAFSVIDPSARSGLEISAEEYYDEVAEAIRSCASEKKRVALFSFCSYEGDDSAIEKIVSRINGTSVEIFSYNGDISGFLNRQNDCECIVATRFHAMVIGWMLSKKI